MIKPFDEAAARPGSNEQKKLSDNNSSGASDNLEKPTLADKESEMLTNRFLTSRLNITRRD